MFPKLFLFCAVLAYVFGGEIPIYYDSFDGEPISAEEYRQRVAKNTTFWCTNVVEPCDPNEWRRIDGSCNNLKNPNRGMPHTPNLRLLPHTFDGNGEKGFEPRKAQSGEPLPSERPLRTSLLPEGRVPDRVFTQLVSHFLVFLVSDVLSIHDTINYVLWKPYCCTPKGKEDKDCIQVKIPDDDPVHRFGHLRCMKLTRPLTYQSEGCLKNDTVPDRIVTPTPTIDLSKLYGQNLETLYSKGRLFKHGLLKYELEEGRMWPPSTKTKDNLCILNQKPVESRCHDTPEPISNSLPGINLFSIWFWRLHNYIATALSKVNPCWDDDKLFYTAREINIAFMVQTIYYELLPALMGRNNLIVEGVISDNPGFRNLYNEQVLPQITAEYAFVLRWFHVIQENEQKMYDAEGNYLRSVPLTNITLRTGYLAIDNNIDYITQGVFRQAGGRFDNLVDPDIAEIGLGPMTEGTDITTFDLVKNRHFGLAPYVKYLEFCNGRHFDTFDDLAGYIKPEMLDVIKDKYKHIEDIDLMAGLWTELPAEGSFLPKTLQCLMMDQHVRFVVSDRHWYERNNRPHAFNLEQLLEIRKSTVSRLLCNVGDTVTEIQPNSFLRLGPGNEITSCENLPTINFWAWKDPACGGGGSTYWYSSGDNEGNPHFWAEATD
ncbi:peroxidase-like [Ostrinia furnacalis]|uniref:peroxidase-like n=1 Tax=Ostrinia furnacalis TaxID=93504 RepID=UPI00103F2D26|nr:peroxidase-like [Ostrinia furnacalis]